MTYSEFHRYMAIFLTPREGTQLSFLPIDPNFNVVGPPLPRNDNIVPYPLFLRIAADGIIVYLLSYSRYEVTIDLTTNPPARTSRSPTSSSRMDAVCSSLLIISSEQIVRLQRERCRERDGRCVLTRQRPYQRRGNLEWEALETAHIIGRGCSTYVNLQRLIADLSPVEFQGFKSIYHRLLYSRIIAWAT